MCKENGEKGSTFFGNIPYPLDGWTNEDFLSVAKTMTKDIDNDGKIDVFGFGFEKNPLFWLPFLIPKANTVPPAANKRAPTMTMGMMTFAFMLVASFPDEPRFRRGHDAFR